MLFVCLCCRSQDLSLDGASLSNSLMGGLSSLTRLTRLSLPAALSLSNFGLEPLQELQTVRELDLSMPLVSRLCGSALEWRP